MRPLRVLVVDDSALNRRALGAMLTDLPEVEVVGVAGDGDEALRLSASLLPDVITLDLEMPRMDGFTFLRLLMASRPVPVIVVSSHSAKDNVFRALELGAIDFIAKPEALVAGQDGQVREQLRQMIAVVRQLSPTSVRMRQGQPPSAASASAATKPSRASQTFQAAAAVPAEAKRQAQDAPGKAASHLVVVAASTGGPTALLEVFAQLPKDAQACVVVAQHMPERFTHAFAQRLDRMGHFRVVEAQGEVELRAGLGIVCPGGKCLEITNVDGRFVAAVVEPRPGDRYAPSADRLFRSAAQVLGSRVRGVVLTGMGDDGAQGALAIKEAGGEVVVESEQTAVIYGMPRATEQVGAASKSMPLPALSTWLATWVLSGKDRT